MEQLAQRGIVLSRSTPGEYKVKCPECASKRKPKNRGDTPLSIRIEDSQTAVWNCHNCGWTGAVGASTRGKARDYRRPDPVAPEPISQGIETFFERRGISREVVESFGVYRATHSFGEAPESCIAFPYFVDGELVNVKYRTSDKRFRQEAGTQRTLFGVDKLKGSWANLVVFVEGEMDVMACAEAGIVAVSLPDGAPKEAKFDSNDKRFDAIRSHEWIFEADSVIIATDGDGPGMALAEELVHRFGRDKCSRVQWPEGIKDANDLLIAKGKQALKDLIAQAEPYPIEGIYRASDYAEQVISIWHGRIQKPLSTGFPLLDQIYKVMPGTFHLVTGVPNHGKSNFVDQLMVNLSIHHGWRFAVFSPEHSTAQHLRRLAEKVVQKPFDIGPTERMTEQELRSAIGWLNEMIYFIEAQDKIPTIDWLLSKAKSAVGRYGVRGIVIDPYNEIDARRDGNKREDEHIRDLISVCKQFCRTHDVTIWMIAHPSKMMRQPDGAIPPPTLYDVSGAAHWNNMADVGLVVHRDFDADLTRVITRKIREQGLYGTIGEAHFQFDITRRVYVEHQVGTPVARHWYEDA